MTDKHLFLSFYIVIIYMYYIARCCFVAIVQMNLS